jgi:dimethylhistidine N-methyltransferase
VIAARSAMAEAVRAGLSAPRRSLPPFLLYDELGSALFDAITLLPEYYVTRTERAILEHDADRIVERALAESTGPVAVLELGAGSASKTPIVLDAFQRAVGNVSYFPADVSRSALDVAVSRLAVTHPRLRVRPVEGTHQQALRQLATWEGTVVAMFLGSSIGNYDDRDSAALLAHVRRTLGRRGALILGVDRAKPVDLLLPAYDDAAGVTAAFNRNLLVRINRELDADFGTSQFRHLAVWNEATSAVEMHLESTVRQRPYIRALDLAVALAPGERIHTESSFKYSDERIGSVLTRAGLPSCARFEDDRGWFALHVARPQS